jgi:hypothetical protein
MKQTKTPDRPGFFFFEALAEPTDVGPYTRDASALPIFLIQVQ